VTITTRDNKNIPITKTFKDLKLVNDREIKVDFQVPPGLESLSVMFDADV
jgi:hypothetical protein